MSSSGEDSDSSSDSGHRSRRKIFVGGSDNSGGINNIEPEPKPEPKPESKAEEKPPEEKETYNMESDESSDEEQQLNIESGVPSKSVEKTDIEQGSGKESDAESRSEYDYDSYSDSDSESGRPRKRIARGLAPEVNSGLTNTIPTVLSESKDQTYQCDYFAFPASKRDPEGPPHICPKCKNPIAIYAKLDPCRHIFCADCGKDQKTCPVCEGEVTNIEIRDDVDKMFICGYPGCGRGYLTMRSLLGHQDQRKHKREPVELKRKRLEDEVRMEEERRKAQDASIEKAISQMSFLAPPPVQLYKNPDKK